MYGGMQAAENLVGFEFSQPVQTFAYISLYIIVDLLADYKGER